LGRESVSFAETLLSGSRREGWLAFNHQLTDTNTYDENQRITTKRKRAGNHSSAQIINAK
jgi:hypothetical protein